MAQSGVVIRAIRARLGFDNVSLVPPDPPLSDGVIIVRPLDESDLPAIERAASDAEILKWFDLHTRGPADYLAAKREAWAEGTGASFAICDATLPDTCLGQVFIERDHDGRGSVGYWLLEDSRGKGRATRAVRLMASWALPEMRLGRLQLHTDPENVASQRVAERAGFTREGVLRAYNGRTGRHPRRCSRLLAPSARPSAHPFRRLLVGAEASAGPAFRNVLRPQSSCTAAWGAYPRGAYSTLANGQSDASHSVTARQSGVSSCAWLARTQESARASYSLSGSG